MAIATVVIYNSYISYVKSAYGITDKSHNKKIERFPKYVSIGLMILALHLSINCKWI